MAKRKNITTTQLALMTAAAVISLRGLPMMAQEELTMFFYIFFATFLFLIPAALVGAELGSAFADRGGGVYTWVKEAFNRHLGFSAIFLQWIQNVVWYPTVLGFAAASIAYMIGVPALAQNGLYVGLFSIAMYWCATLVTLRGTSAISGITSKGFLIGTVLPGVVVIVMAVIWMAGGNEIALKEIPAGVSQIVNVDAAQHVHPRLFPHITGMSDIAFLAGILLLFAGVEVHAVHAPELAKPQTQFPRAMFLAALISFGLFTLGALAVAIITPYDQINLQSGLFTTFQIAFERYHVGWLSNVMGLLVAFGALAGVVDFGPQPRPALDGQGRRSALLPPEDQQERRAAQHTDYPGLHRDAPLVALHRDGRRQRGVLPVERPDRRTLPHYVYDDVRRRNPPALHAAQAYPQLPRTGRKHGHVADRRRGVPRRAVLVHRHLLPAFAAARGQSGDVHVAGGDRHGGLPRDPFHHQFRNGQTERPADAGGLKLDR